MNQPHLLAAVPNGIFGCGESFQLARVRPSQIRSLRHEGGRRVSLFAILIGLWVAAPLNATDVAFWHEYRPTEHDADQTCLLLQFSEWPPAAVGPIERVDSVGNPVLETEGRFGKALKLDGRSGLRCVPTGVFDGGRVSIEAWVKLEQYPDKEGCIVFRPACVDAHSTYDPQADRSKGFALSLDATGALHLDTVNTFYGQRTRTSTDPGAVPLHRWVHLAGICGPGRRLFVDGRELVNQPINWGQGLTVQGDKNLIRNRCMSATTTRAMPASQACWIRCECIAMSTNSGRRKMTRGPIPIG